MADWGWGFITPQPLPNPVLSRAKGNFRVSGLRRAKLAEIGAKNKHLRDVTQVLCYLWSH